MDSKCVDNSLRHATALFPLITEAFVHCRFLWLTNVTTEANTSFVAVGDLQYFFVSVTRFVVLYIYFQSNNNNNNVKI
jgi:hypothetical protein